MRLARMMVMGVAVFVAPLAHAAGFDQSHALLGDVLKRYVQDDLVKYVELKAGREELDRYLGQIETVSEADFKKWTEKQQLAFLINAYNTFTLRLILDHYPVKSIKDIGTTRTGPWDQPVVRLFGGNISLNTVEIEMLRAWYQEPRIHFALVCAARGCPPLRKEAFVATRLDAQLDDQAKTFLATAKKNRVDNRERIVYLSPILKWYGADFEKKSGSVLAALKAYWPEREAASLAKGDFSVRYTDYDWSLNDAAEK